jgi:hypothetical protein
MIMKEAAIQQPLLSNGFACLELEQATDEWHFCAVLAKMLQAGQLVIVS